MSVWYVLGEHWNLNAYYERCSVILIHGSQDIFQIFNLVQEVFNQYDTWEERLWFILRHGAALSQMLDASRGIFENPMLLIGSDFRYLGVTEEEYLKKQLGLQLDTQSFDVEKMATFLSLHDMSNYVREPLLLELQGRRSLSVNIFDQEEYLGCLTVFEESRPFRSSDRALAVFFPNFCDRLFSRIRFCPVPVPLYDEPCAASFPGSVLILNIVVL